MYEIVPPIRYFLHSKAEIGEVRRQLEKIKNFCQQHCFIHSVFCLTTGPKPPLKRCLHIGPSRASSFKWEYPLLSLRSSSRFLRLLPRLLATSISRFIFLPITCFRRQFLRKMWPIQLAFHCLFRNIYGLCFLCIFVSLFSCLVFFY